MDLIPIKENQSIIQNQSYLRKILSSWSSTLNVNRVKSAMGMKSDHMAAMEEMEADNMDQNLGMENQDLSRGNNFFCF